jgi:hypothetical protein
MPPARAAPVLVSRLISAADIFATEAIRAKRVAVRLCLAESVRSWAATTTGPSGDRGALTAWSVVSIR